MALTFTALTQFSMGSLRGEAFNVSSDGTSGSVTTSLGAILYGTITPVSAGTLPAFKINTTAASAACNGAFFVSSGTNGDVYTVVVYGKS